MRQEQILDLTTRYPVQSGIAALAGFLVLFTAGRAVRRTAKRATSGKRSEDVLTVVAAVIATVVQADGMWIFFRDIVPVPVYLRILMFAFLEVALFTSGLRARRNIKETEEHSAGVDGMAVWVLAAISGTLASTTAGSFRGALLRLTAAAVAAWLWERGLAGERRRARKKDRKQDRRINWRLTPERVLVRLGVAEPTDRTASDVDAHRRITRVARRAKALRSLKAAGAWSWRVQRAQRRLDRAMAQADEHADLATDPDRQDALMAHIGALYNAAALADISPAAPWIVPAERPTLRLVRRTRPVDDPLTDLGEFLETPETLRHWLEDEDRRTVPAEQVPVPPYVAPHQIEGARVFADEVRRGHVPGIRAIKKRMNVAQEKAQQVRAYLKYLIAVGDGSAFDEDKEPQHA